MPLVRVDWKPTHRKLRQFGVAVLVMAAAWSFVTDGNLVWVLRGIAAGGGLAALLSPALLRPLYLLLTVIGIPIGFVVSHVVLAIIFFGVVTPTGLLVRLIKGDPLHRRWERDRASYLVARKQSPAKRYLRTF